MSDERQKHASAKSTPEKQSKSAQPAKTELEQVAQEAEPRSLVQLALATPPPALKPDNIVALQRTVGNRAVNRWLARKTRPDTGSGSASARHPENKTGLPDDLKSGVESLSGMSLDDVSVHYHSSRPAELKALAYTEGKDIYVKPGQEEHLAHEAWHVVQQKQGRVRPTANIQGKGLNDDAGLEREADVMGGRAIAQPVRPQRVSASASAESPSILQAKVIQLLGEAAQQRIKMSRVMIGNIKDAQRRWGLIKALLKQSGEEPTDENIQEAAKLIDVTVEKPPEVAEKETVTEKPPEESKEQIQARALAVEMASKMKSENLAALAETAKCTAVYQTLKTLKSRQEEAQIRLRNCLVFAKYADQVTTLLATQLRGDSALLTLFVEELARQTGAIQIIPNDSGTPTPESVGANLKAGQVALETVLGVGASPLLILNKMFAHDKGFVVAVDSTTEIIDAVFSGTSGTEETEGAAVNVDAILTLARKRGTKTDPFTTNEDGLKDWTNKSAFMTIADRLKELVDSTDEKAQKIKELKGRRTITDDMYLNLWGALSVELMLELKVEELSEIGPYLGNFRRIFPELPEAAFDAFYKKYPKQKVLRLIGG